jgi:hypothetical protein
MVQGMRSAAAGVLAYSFLCGSLLGCSVDQPADLGVYSGPALADPVRTDTMRDAAVDDAGPRDVTTDAEVAADASTTGDAGRDAGAPPTALRFRVTTTSLRGHFAPRNIGAIWIETAGGAYVKTLARWADDRRRYLNAYLTASDGDATDAVTSATLRDHLTHSVRWDLTDWRGRPMPDGSYRVRMQLTESQSGGAVAQITFVKGREPAALTPPDLTGFSAMSLRFE